MYSNSKLYNLKYCLTQPTAHAITNSPNPTNQWSSSKVLLEQRDNKDQRDSASKRKALKSSERKSKNFIANDLLMSESHLTLWFVIMTLLILEQFMMINRLIKALSQNPKGEEATYNMPCNQKWRFLVGMVKVLLDFEPVGLYSISIGRSNQT